MLQGCRSSRPRFPSHQSKRALPATRSQAIIRPGGPPYRWAAPGHRFPENPMDRMHLPARTPLMGLVALLVLGGCSSGRSGSAGPAPAAGPGGSAAPTRVMEVPALEAFDRAVANGTRLSSGAPGPRYWQQWADYRLEAELNPVSKRLTGKAAIRYHNRSPD